MVVVLEVVVWVVGAALAVLLVRRFGRPDGGRFLARWGLGRAGTEQEVAAVRDHVRRRRLWTVLGFVGLSALLAVAGRATGTSDLVSADGRWLAALLLGLLVGELAAVLHQRGRVVRTASLTPRPAAVLVPGWARWGGRTVLLLAVVLLGVVALQARWWSGPLPGAVTAVRSNDPATVARLATVPSGVWAVLAAALLALLVVELTVHLARTRPAGPVPEDVDLLLRARAARVATGVGLGTGGVLLAVALRWSHQRVESLGGLTGFGDLQIVWQNTSGAGPVLVPLLCVLGWIFVGNPPGRPVLRALRPAPA